MQPDYHKRLSLYNNFHMISGQQQKAGVRDGDEVVADDEEIVVVVVRRRGCKVITLRGYSVVVEQYVNI